jgi:hypothetical protein
VIPGKYLTHTVSTIGVGTSSNPCRDTYHGTRPFSEVESRNVASYLYGIRSRLVGYMDIHAYSQLWMTPWGHAKGAYPPTYNEMVREMVSVKKQNDESRNLNAELLSLRE